MGPTHNQETIRRLMRTVETTLGQKTPNFFNEQIKKTRILLVEMIKKENLRDGSILNHFSIAYSFT